MYCSAPTCFNWNDTTPSAVREPFGGSWYTLQVSQTPGMAPWDRCTWESPPLPLPAFPTTSIAPQARFHRLKGSNLTAARCFSCAAYAQGDGDPASHELWRRGGGDFAPNAPERLRGARWGPGRLRLLPLPDLGAPTEAAAEPGASAAWGDAGEGGSCGGPTHSGRIHVRLVACSSFHSFL